MISMTWCPGDSRAVLCRRGRPIALSIDHKPNLETATGHRHGRAGPTGCILVSSGEKGKNGDMVTYPLVI